MFLLSFIFSTFHNFGFFFFLSLELCCGSIQLHFSPSFSIPSTTETSCPADVTLSGACVKSPHTQDSHTLALHCAADPFLSFYATTTVSIITVLKQIELSATSTLPPAQLSNLPFFLNLSENSWTVVFQYRFQNQIVKVLTKSCWHFIGNSLNFRDGCKQKRHRIQTKIFTKYVWRRKDNRTPTPAAATKLMKRSITRSCEASL